MAARHPVDYGGCGPPCVRLTTFHYIRPYKGAFYAPVIPVSIANWNYIDSLIKYSSVRHMPEESGKFFPPALDDVDGQNVHDHLR